MGVGDIEKHPALQVGRRDADLGQNRLNLFAVLGGFVYGTLNRLLIPLGLHHILNNPPWFIFGEYTTAGGEVVHGDIPRFLAGDPTAGAFMTGFFPIMMFALPAAALAIWHEARPEHKKAVGGIMLSAGLTAFLTGVTEPLEFAFMFVAFPLYVIHALLTGTSLALVNWLGIKDGFGFSAGLFDYLLNFNIATHPLWLALIGLGYAVVYYFLFRFVIRKWNLRTMGREDEGEGAGQICANLCYLCPGWRCTGRASCVAHRQRSPRWRTARMEAPPRRRARGVPSRWRRQRLPGLHGFPALERHRRAR